MKEVSDVTFLVVDSGLFLPFARRLAEEAKRVIWYNSDRQSFPSLKQGCIGDGFEDLDHTLDFWPLLKDVDCVCFPDIGHAGLQDHLRRLGFPVWGSGDADALEINREGFLGKLDHLGLQVPEFTVKVGVKALGEYLVDKEDQYIKVSRWRGDMETTHWRNWKMDNGWLDWLAVSLGPLKHYLRFLVFPAIKTPLEIGGDNYNVRGQWPQTMLNGLEHKDTTYFSSVTKYGDMPEQLQEIMDAFGPLLRGAATQWSMEVRIKGDKALFLDPTLRGGMPSSASQQLLWANFPEIIWAGANGELVEPEPVAKFSIECMVTSKTGKECWDVVELPKALERHMRFSSCCYVDGCYGFPPDEFHSGELGWLCAIGDTPRETLDRAKELCDLLPDGLDGNIENLVGLIKEVEEGEKQGIPLTPEPMPEPAEVIED